MGIRKSVASIFLPQKEAHLARGAMEEHWAVTLTCPHIMSSKASTAARHVSKATLGLPAQPVL